MKPRLHDKGIHEFPAIVGRADLHLHTHFSDGIHSPRDMVSEAARVGLNVIAITDHDMIEGALQAQSYSNSQIGWGVDVVVGEEISSLNGHIIGLFLKDLIPPRLTARRTVELIHAQGGLAVLAHPFHAYTGRFRGFPKAASLISDIPFDAIETINRDNAFSFFSQPKAERLALRFGLAPLGVSDAHSKSLIGMGFTEFEGRTALDFRTALQNQSTRAREGRAWGPAEIATHLKDATRIAWRYSRIRSAA